MYKVSNQWQQFSDVFTTLYIYMMAYSCSTSCLEFNIVLRRVVGAVMQGTFKSIQKIDDQNKILQTEIVLLLSVPARVYLLSAGYLTSAELAVRLSNSMKIWNKVTPISQVLKLSLFYVLSNYRVVIGIVMHVNGFKNDIGPCTD